MQDIKRSGDQIGDQRQIEFCRDVPVADLSVVFDRKMTMLTKTLATVEEKCIGLQSRAWKIEEEKEKLADR